MNKKSQNFPYSTPAKFTRRALMLAIILATLALLAAPHAPGSERKAAGAFIEQMSLDRNGFARTSPSAR